MKMMPFMINKCIFLLTKPPKHTRAELCFKLLKRSKEASLYLCGDGVYCALGGQGGLDDILPSKEICVYACKEDMEARGLQAVAEINAITEADFYKMLVENMMTCSHRVYAF